MNDIVVIGAPPPGTNPGMAAVDLGAHSLARRHGWLERLSFVRLYQPEELRHNQDAKVRQRQAARMALPMEFSSFREQLDQLSAAKVVLFWGDFCHTREYSQAVSTLLIEAGMARDQAHAMDLIDRHLFLTQASQEVLKKTLVFGETTLFNRASDLTDSAYVAKAEKFLRSVRRVWMREPYSAQWVGSVRSELDRSHLGVDCATLNHGEDLDRLVQGPWSARAPDAQGKVGIFFGRSSLKGKILGRFARDLCAKLDRPAVWLPWGDSAFDPLCDQIRRGFRSMEIWPIPEPPTVGDLFNLLRRFELVITDTYHMCVLSWLHGVPAVCIADVHPQQAMCVSSGRAYGWRDKRQVLFSMYDAMEFFVYRGEVEDRSWMPRRVYHLSQLLPRREVIATVTARMRQHRDQVEKNLVTEIQTLLG